MTKELRVLIDGDEIGSVIQDARGKFQFDYDEDYRAKSTAIPLSISMPLSLGTHGDKAIKPFLWGLLPDNDDTLNNWGRRFGVNPRNPFALLGEIGEDLQGAIQMIPPDKLGELKKREGTTLLSREVLSKSFAELIRDPGAVQFTVDGSRLGTPIRLDAFGRATLTTNRLEPGKHQIGATYVAPKAQAGFLPSVSFEMLHLVVARD